MRRTGPGENKPPRPRQGRPGQGYPGEGRPRYRPQWRETARLPSNAWREGSEARVWRADAQRTGHRRGGRGPGRELGNAGRPLRSRGSWSGRVLRGLSGSLAAGLVVLAIGLLGVQLWQSGRGQPGPEWPVVIGHVAAAALAAGFQRFADRHRGMIGALAAVAVVAVVAMTLWIWWLN